MDAVERAATAFQGMLDHFQGLIERLEEKLEDEEAASVKAAGKHKRELAEARATFKATREIAVKCERALNLRAQFEAGEHALERVIVVVAENEARKALAGEEGEPSKGEENKD